jgi:hypothetical protein
MHRAIYVEKLDAEKVKAYAHAMQLMDETLPDYVKAKVRQNVIERVFGEKQQTLEEKEVRKFFDRTAADKISEDAIIDSGLSFGLSEQPIVRPFKDILGSPQPEE